MINAGSLLLFVVLLTISTSANAQSIVSTSASGGSTARSAQFLPLSMVREGMRGTARTVFRGTEPEEFNVEILGILPGGVGPKQDLIVGRLSGGGAERTAVFAGMSGSPVYVNGKLVGAISYAFPFAKEPICGITPIEQMISIFEQKQLEGKKDRDPGPISFAELSAAAALTDFPKNGAAHGLASGMSSSSAMAAVAGQTFQRIATPLAFTGFSRQTLDLFGPQLAQAGLMPVATAGGSSPITPLKEANDKTLIGGTSVIMQLTRGDYSIAAAGTVTFRDGEKIYAFGHPFLSLGSADLPMSESHVVTVVPNMNNSFKLSVPDAMVGAMTQDRATGVYGSLGRAPKMIPVKINVRNSRGKTETVDFEVANDDFLTPLLINMGVFNTLVAQERTVGETMVELEGKVNIKGQQPLVLNRRFAGSTAGQLAAASVASPIMALMRSKFDDLEISSIEIDLASADGSKTGVLDRVAVDRTRVNPGETVELQAFARAPSGRFFTQRIQVPIPADTPAGPLSINIGDGFTLQQASPFQQFVPRDLTELIQTINKMRLPDRLYVQTSRTTKGVMIGTSEMPNLPPSMLATLNNDRTAGGLKAVTQKVESEAEVPPAAFIISGQQSITIEVIR